MSQAEFSPNQIKRTKWAVIPALVIPLIGSLFYFVLLKDSGAGRLTYSATKVFTLIWPLVALGLIVRVSLKGWTLEAPLERGEQARFWKNQFSAIPLGVLMGVGIVGLMFLFMETPLGDVIRAGAPAVREKTQSLGVLDHFVLFATFISIVHSLLEEYYWRWFVFGGLSRFLSRWPALVIGGLGFAAHHLVVTTQFFPFPAALFLSVCVGIGGILWSVLYRKQGTLTGAWVSHAIVDMGIMWIGYELLKQPS